MIILDKCRIIQDFWAVNKSYGHYSYSFLSLITINGDSTTTYDNLLVMAGYRIDIQKVI